LISLSFGTASAIGGYAIGYETVRGEAETVGYARRGAATLASVDSGSIIGRDAAGPETGRDASLYPVFSAFASYRWFRIICWLVNL